jgi:hypothetical protein
VRRYWGKNWRENVRGRKRNIFVGRDPLFKYLDFVEFVEAFLSRQIPGPIETLAALAAPVGAIGQEEQDPKFNQPPAPGAMHVFAAAQRTISFCGVYEQAKNAFHRERIIAPGESGRNRPAWMCCRTRISANQNEARTCMA